MDDSVKIDITHGLYRGTYFISVLLALASLSCLQDATPSSGIGGVITEYPARASLNEPITIKWRMEYPSGMNLTHIAVHYGFLAHPGDVGLDVDPIKAGYAGAEEIPPEVFKFTNQFEVTLLIRQKGELYFRVHAVLDGQHYWSDEKTIEVG